MRLSVGGITRRITGRWGKAKGKKGAGAISRPLPKLLGALKKESAVSQELHQEVLGALRHMQAKDPSLEKALKDAYGYAVLPNVGKASAVLGGAFGMGEVFVRGRVIGYAAVVQITIGVQVGGQTYHELLLFDSREALDAFKQSKVSFAANASAVMVSAGAAATAGKRGTRVFVHPEGGMGIEAGIGGQKVIFKPAALGRLKTSEPKATARQAAKFGAPPTPPSKGLHLPELTKS